jgi:hypothetical protein
VTAASGIRHAGLKPARTLKIFGKPEISEEEILHLVFFLIAVLFIVFSLLSLVHYQALSPHDAMIRGSILPVPTRSQS